MRDFLIRMKSGKVMLAFVLLMALTVANTDLLSLSKGGKPQIPRLSLTGAAGGYNDQWYPDGRIWLPIASNGTREFLMPVFIDNRYDTRILSRVGLPDTILYTVDPIKSFRFKMLYDSGAVRVVGVQATNPDNAPVELGEDPLARSFNISWSDTSDVSYLYYTKGPSAIGSDDAKRGRGVTISGSSEKALATTATFNQPDQVNFKVLLYVRFRIVPTSFAALGSSRFTPAYIAPDTIMYNDWNAAKEPILKKYRENATTSSQWNSDFGSTFFTAAKFFSEQDLSASFIPYTLALAGIDNTQAKIGNPQLAPCPPGCIYLRFFSNQPTFKFSSNRSIDANEAIVKSPKTVNGQQVEDPSNWEILTPLTVDNKPGSTDIGLRAIKVENDADLTRMTDVTIESDSPWLQFKTQSGPGLKNSIPSPTRSGYINWLDKGILEGVNGITTEEGANPPVDGITKLEIQCNPSLLPNNNSGEKEGIHIGYLTFKSSFANYSPTRLKITFIYFKAPQEGNRAGVAPGIKIKMRNSKPVIADTTTLIFGTGPRATRGVDTLYGEYAKEFCNFCSNANPRVFGAAFFPYKMKPADSLLTAKYGFGDFAKNDETPYASSRDIRSVDDTTESITYLVNFYANGDNNYPVTLEWDLRDFPDGSNLFLKDNLNGGGFPAVDMRNSTVTGQYTRSFVIQDPKITSYLIEYTLPTVINYVDGSGTPIIKTGWNMVSIPVKPTNRTSDTIYKQAITKKLYNYALGNYQENAVLEAGIGYFVKYGLKVDQQFAGSVIREISPSAGNIVKLWPGDNGKGGWNSVGGLSIPTSITYIDFVQYSNVTLPDKNYTLKYGVWTYTTNNGYFEVSEIKPGLGYFIKVDKDGYYKLTNPAFGPKLDVNNVPVNQKEAIYKASTLVRVSDNGHSSAVVYLSNNKDLEVANFEMPPAPGVGMFDVRFGTTGTNLVNNDNAVINLQGVEYPISIASENAHANLTFMDAISGQVFGTITKGSNKNLEIKSSSNLVRVVATESNEDAFSFMNYPNPVTNSTNFNYNVANDGNVTIEIFNQVGSTVATVVNEFQKAGNHSKSFDASNLTSGTYVVKFNSNGNTATRTISIVK